MFGDPLAAFAIALFFLRSALDATAAGGSGGGTDCACEACAGAAAVELVRYLAYHVADVLSVLLLVARTIAAQCPCLAQ